MFDRIMLAFHVFGAFIWIGGLFALAAALDALCTEPVAEARERLARHARVAGLVPDIGATIAMIFGAHWLFKFKDYESHFMWPKFAMIAGVLVVHFYLRRKLRFARKQTGVPPPAMLVKPLLSAMTLAILIFVIAKIPA